MNQSFVDTAAIAIADSLIAESLQGNKTVTYGWNDEVFEALAAKSFAAFEHSTDGIVRGELDGVYWEVKLIKP